MRVSTTSRLTFLTRNPSIGYWRRHGNAPSQSGRETLLFQTIWMMRTASQKGEYSEMCSGCHLAPGMKRTEISQGLYPRAPELRRKTGLTPAEQFWVVKHGIKMTGMPAWGVTHDDDLLWDVVAFVRKLPELTPEQYETLVKNAPKHEELMQKMEMGGEHQHNGGHE